MALPPFALAMFLLAAPAVPSDPAISAERWTQIGPPPMAVFDVAMSAAERSTLYAGTLHGVFKSLDGGDHWFPSSVGLPGDGFYGSPVQALSLSVNPAAPDILLAGTERGVFRSVNAGDSWVMSEDGILPMGGPVSELHQDTHDPNLVYAISTLYSYLSTDGGQTWSRLSGPGQYLKTMVIDPADGHHVFATNGGNLISSADAGKSWSTLTFPPGEVLYSLALDPRGRALLAATSRGIYKSSDAGGTWSYANSDVVAERLAVDPSDSNVVYAATFSELIRTTDGALSWEVVELPPTTGSVVRPATFGSRPALLLDPGNSRMVFASGSRGLFRSQDQGASWSESDSGLSQFSVGALTPIPGPQASLLLGYAGGTGFQPFLLRGDSRGLSWQESYDGMTSSVVHALVADPGLPDVIYAAGGGIFRSTDGGLNWTILEPGIFGSMSGQTGVIWSFAVDPTRATTLYAGTLAPWKYQGLSASGVFKSIDGGATWIRSVSGLPSPQMPTIFSLIVDRSRPGTVYAGTGDGVFKSSDEGASWARSGLAGLQVNVLSLAPGSPAVLFAGLDQGGIQRSDDGGQTWNSSPDGLPNVSIWDMKVDPRNSQALFLATFGAGVYRSRDQGRSWEGFNEGLADLQLTKLAFDASGSYLFAGGWNLGVSVRQILMDREKVRRGPRRPGTRGVMHRNGAERPTTPR
jgi:photosystem II stability/assembly factor-like uncharacterized protein